MRVGAGGRGETTHGGLLKRKGEEPKPFSLTNQNLTTITTVFYNTIGDMERILSKPNLPTPN